MKAMTSAIFPFLMLILFSTGIQETFGQIYQPIVFTAPCDSFAIFNMPTHPARIKNNIPALDSLINKTISRQPEDREVTAYYHYNFYIDCQGRFVASTLETYDGTQGMGYRILKLLNTHVKWEPALQSDQPVNTMVKVSATVKKGKIYIVP